MKKEYTVIYGKYSGYSDPVTTFTNVFCEADKVSEKLKEEHIDVSQVWFVFEGPCKVAEWK